MKSWKKILAAAALLIMLGTSTDVWAIEQPTDPDSPYGYENVWNCMSRKLGRGIVNAGFGVLEIPLQMAEVNFNEGGLAALTYGIIGGVGYFLYRECVGIVEIITFPSPLPNCPNDPHGYGAGYGPIIYPEWIITPSTDYYNFVFSKSAFVN